MTDQALPVSLIVFDFDGTICDSAGIKDEAFRLLYLAEMGSEFAQRVQAYHLENAGVSRFEKIKHIEAVMIGRPHTPEGVAEIAGRFGALVEDQVVAANMIPGAAEFLERAERPIATIASATPTDELRRIVRRRGLGRAFEAVDGAPTSKAAIVQLHMERFSVAPEATVMVGDQPSDYRAAVESGVAFVGVGPEAPVGEHTIASIADLTDLEAALRTRLEK